MGAFARVIARSPAAARDDLIHTIAGEYREMPGMRLTRLQFARLWNLEPRQCEEVLGELIARGDLSEYDDGRIGSRCDVM